MLLTVAQTRVHTALSRVLEGCAGEDEPGATATPAAPSTDWAVTEQVPLPLLAQVDKLFGPGNQYVTAAKMLLQNSEAMVAIDMPAGPSEVLVIADAEAPLAHVAADLLSQAEHGPDSQVGWVGAKVAVVCRPEELWHYEAGDLCSLPDGLMQRKLQQRRRGTTIEYQNEGLQP